MIFKRPRFAAATTFFEVVTAIFIMTVAVLGASGYKYYAALDARRAATHRTASRVALSLCESWRGQGLAASATYDPVAHLGSDLSITNTVTGPAAPFGFNELGHYEIVIDDTYYWVTLSWKDVFTGLRALNVALAWDERGSGEDSFDENAKLFKLTMYVYE